MGCRLIDFCERPGTAKGVLSPEIFIKLRLGEPLPRGRPLSQGASLAARSWLGRAVL